MVTDIEHIIAGWMKDLPHLPKDLTKWLADNAWWLAIIGVVLGAIGVVSMLSVMTVGSAFVGAVAGAAVGGTLFLSSMLSIAVAAVAVVVAGLAISPLKAMQKKGWDLLFLSVLISFAGGVILNLVGLNIVGALYTALGAAIGCYVLLEVQSYFAAK